MNRLLGTTAQLLLVQSIAARHRPRGGVMRVARVRAVVAGPGRRRCPRHVDDAAGLADRRRARRPPRHRRGVAAARRSAAGSDDAAAAMRFALETAALDLRARRRGVAAGRPAGGAAGGAADGQLPWSPTPTARWRRCGARVRDVEGEDRRRQAAARARLAAIAAAVPRAPAARSTPTRPGRSTRSRPASAAWRISRIDVRRGAGRRPGRDPAPAPAAARRARREPGRARSRTWLDRAARQRRGGIARSSSPRCSAGSRRAPRWRPGPAPTASTPSSPTPSRARWRPPPAASWRARWCPTAPSASTATPPSRPGLSPSRNTTGAPSWRRQVRASASTSTPCSRACRPTAETEPEPSTETEPKPR